jgi:glycine dehydrogenase
LAITWHLSLDETTTRADVELLWKIFAPTARPCPTFERIRKARIEPLIPRHCAAPAPT